MDEKVKDQDVLLVKEKSSDELKVVAGIEKDGKPKTVEAKQENEPSFLKIDKNGNALDNFMSNFLRQYKDPTHFQFFKAPIDKVKEVIDKLREAFKKPDDPANKATIDKYKVEPQVQGQKQSAHAIDENRVDWSQLEKFGVTRETLEKTKSLDAMLNWQKSPVLIPIAAKFDDTTLRTDARLSFRETPDGNLTLAIHAIRKEPELERPYFGIKFTDEDKQNLLTTGNLGRVASAEYKQGEHTPVFISLDKLTNELVALRADKLKIPETIKGVTLNDIQKKELSEGKAVLVEGMTSKSGKEFSSLVQVNADKKGIEFRFDNQPKQVLSNQTKLSNEKELLTLISEQGMAGLNQSKFFNLSETGQNAFLERNQLQPFIKEYNATNYQRETELLADNFDTAHKLVEHMDKLNEDLKNEAKAQLSNEQNNRIEVRIPKTLLGVELSDKQRSQLQEGKIAYIAGMTDNKGQDFNAYVKVNNERGKLDFFKWNPDKSQAKEVTPDNASKTQVAVNNEGKTNEATKKVDEPLKKGQTQPTEKQSEKQDKKEAKENKQATDKPKKSKGVKM